MFVLDLSKSSVIVKAWDMLKNTVVANISKFNEDGTIEVVLHLHRFVFQVGFSFGFGLTSEQLHKLSCSVRKGSLFLSLLSLAGCIWDRGSCPICIRSRCHASLKTSF